MPIPNKKERELRALREKCLAKRDAIREKLAGRSFSSIEDYEYDSFYALYAEAARLSAEVADKSEGDEARMYADLRDVCSKRLNPLEKKKKYN